MTKEELDRTIREFIPHRDSEYIPDLVNAILALWEEEDYIFKEKVAKRDATLEELGFVKKAKTRIEVDEEKIEDIIASYLGIVQKDFLDIEIRAKIIQKLSHTLATKISQWARIV